MFSSKEISQADSLLIVEKTDAALVGEFSHGDTSLGERQEIIVCLRRNSDLSGSTATCRSSTALNYLRTSRILVTG